MAGRFPFGSQGHSGNDPLHNAQVRAALGLSQMDEALYLQRQQELQRDFQIRQMLLQEQLDHQSRLDSMLHEHQLKAIEQLQDFPDLQHYSRYLISEQLQRQGERERDLVLRERQMQHHEELRRRQVLAHSQPQPQQQLSNNSQQGQPPPPQQPAQAPSAQAASKPPASAQVAAAKSALLRDLAADSLAGNAVKRSELEKRVFAKPEEVDEAPVKKRPRSGTNDSVELLEKDRKPKGKKTKRSAKKQDKSAEPPKPSTAAAAAEAATMMKPSAQDLLDFATASSSPTKVQSPAGDRKLPALPPPHMTPPPPPPKISLGTLGDLLEAASAEKKSDDAIEVLVGIRRHVDWPESEPEDDAKEEEEEQEEDDAETIREIARAVEKGETIQLPGFTSILPQLPEEPEIEETGEKKKFKSILDDDSVDSKAPRKKAAPKPTAAEKPAAVKKEVAVVDYPYPVDTWWPSVSSVRRERKAVGEPQDEDAFEDDPDVPSPTSEFRANLDKIKESFANEVTPGVLEKMPHCKIHRMLMKKRKNPSAPELVFCFQVTELYPNDVMVCCSHCGTWRHTACGGHHKPYSIRECIDTPFNAVCDRCHEEEKILRDYPVARRRIDRQRTEQIRRALSTSAAMRQASFSKHGGTYKWPLGSVSATHIGGHTRSVHSRHDKAEKQWTDMATRLSRASYKPKERVKIRTKELERLLVSVEDAEGHTDRHNMMVFLLQDTLREHPVGFETKRRNIFDPEEDEIPNDIPESPRSPESPEGDNKSTAEDSRMDTDGEMEDDDEIPRKEPSVCSRSGCTKRPRFDSLFCSDSCGVSALESDLVRTFQYASDIHPSLLRN